LKTFGKLFAFDRVLVGLISKELANISFKYICNKGSKKDETACTDLRVYPNCKKFTKVFKTTPTAKVRVSCFQQIPSKKTYLKS
jgi:hypothetical protein